MATTELGKALRKLRIDQEERLLDMARKIEKSSAFVSAVETGTKSPPVGFEDVISKAYKLGKEASEQLRRAADASRKAFTLQPNSVLGRDTAGLLARRMNSLSEEQLKQIQTVIMKGD